jgi:hypothetical protein
MSSRWFLVKREGKIEGPFEEGFLITMAKQGRLLPTDELAENQDGPWEIAKTHPVVIAAKPKKRNTLQINDYKVLTRKASEDKYEIRYWCTKCSTTIIVEEEEALRDYRCPACDIPSTIVDEAFTEITADREERQRRAREKEQKIIEKERVKEERLIAREDRLKRRKETLTKLASATTAAAKETAKTASSVVSNAAMATTAVANTATTLAKDGLKEAAKPENIASRKKAMSEGVGYVKEKMETAKHTAKNLTDSELLKTFRKKLCAVFLNISKAGNIASSDEKQDSDALYKNQNNSRDLNDSFKLLLTAGLVCAVLALIFISYSSYQERLREWESARDSNQRELKWSQLNKDIQESSPRNAFVASREMREQTTKDLERAKDENFYLEHNKPRWWFW